MSDAAPLTPALEDYLEAIFGVANRAGEARVNAIAKRLSVHKSTVTCALRCLLSSCADAGAHQGPGRECR